MNFLEENNKQRVKLHGVFSPRAVDGVEEGVKEDQAEIPGPEQKHMNTKQIPSLVPEEVNNRGFCGQPET